VPAKLRLGIIGCGGICAAHLKGLAAMSDLEIVGMADPQKPHMDARVAELKAINPDASPQTFADGVEMIAATGPDVVYIMIPPYAHGPMERACIERKIPFFTEKPMALDMGFVREIAAEVEKAGLLTCVGYMNRYRKGVQKARELFKKDPAALAFGDWIGGSPNPKPTDTGGGSWWTVMSKSGGQAVEQCTHTFDLVRFICGEAVEVFAHAATGFNVGLYNYDVHDASLVNIKLKNGGIANLVSACMANAGGGGVTLNIFGHDTTAMFSGWEHNVKILQVGKEPEEIKGEGDIFVIEDTAFLNAVRKRDGSGIQCQYSDGLKSLELGLAANQSMATGKPVEIQG